MVASLVLYVGLSLRGNPGQAFFLTPARFWELTAGCGAYLLHRGSGSARDLGRRLALPRWRGPLSLLALSRPAGVVAAAGVLAAHHHRRHDAADRGAADPDAAHGRSRPMALPPRQPGHRHGVLLPLPLALAGDRSRRWTVGFSPLTLLPVLVLITLFTALSYRLERLFRYDHPALAGLGRPGLTYPGMTLAAICLQRRSPGSRP